MSSNKTVPELIDFNDKVLADLSSENRILRDDNIRRTTWLYALTGLVGLLAISNTAALLVAVRLSNSMSVDPMTGALTHLGSDTPVSTIATGNEHVFTLPEDGNVMCVSTDEIGHIWDSTMTGTPTTAVFKQADETAEINGEAGLSLTASGSFFNGTLACLTSSDQSFQMCFDLASNTCNTEGRALSKIESNPTPKRSMETLSYLECKQRSLFTFATKTTWDQYTGIPPSAGVVFNPKPGLLTDMQFIFSPDRVSSFFGNY